MQSLFINGIHYKQVIVIILAILSFATMFKGIYEIYNYIKKFGILSSTIASIYSRLNEQSKKREEEQMLSRIKYGNSEDRTIIARLDRVVTYSGIELKIKWMKTEVVITIMMISSVIITVVMTICTKNLVLSIGVAIIVNMIFHITLLVMGNMNYLKVQDGMIEFMGNIQNFSHANSDLMAIFEKSVPYLSEPIRSNVQRCVIEARYSGNKLAALQRLESSLENSYFKLVISSLAQSLLYNNDYSRTIEECKDLVEEFVRFEQERRVEYRNSRLEVLVLVALGVIATITVTYANGISLKDALKATGMEIVFNIYLIVVMVIVIYIIFIKGVKHS